MKSLHTLTALLLVIAAAAVVAQAPLPRDVDPKTGNRFPAIKPDAPDSFGPAAIRMYSPNVAESMTAVNQYLRYKSGLEPRLVELAILVTAREMDCQYVWTAHEPPALKAGLPQEVIDLVKFRRPVANMGDKETVIVQMGRDLIRTHKVGSDTFARAVKLFGHQGVVDIVSLMGDYAATTMLLNAADQHVRPKDKPLLPMP